VSFLPTDTTVCITCALSSALELSRAFCLVIAVWWLSTIFTPTHGLVTVSLELGSPAASSTVPAAALFGARVAGLALASDRATRGARCSDRWAFRDVGLCCVFSSTTRVDYPHQHGSILCSWTLLVTQEFPAGLHSAAILPLTQTTDHVYLLGIWLLCLAAAVQDLVDRDAASGTRDIDPATTAGDVFLDHLALISLAGLFSP
jgi:hypothetical protein